MNLKINVAPNSNQLAEIKNWLTDEYKKNEEGFLCNWNIIENYFNRNELIVLLMDSVVIGFTTWKIEDEIVLIIDIAEIHPNYRAKSYGKFMMSETFMYCKDKGVMVVKLFCEPRSSYTFWKKMGFIDMPFVGFYQHELSLYKPLIDIQKPLEDNHFENEILELWDCVPIDSKVTYPKWTWSAKSIEGRISPPILSPCCKDWKIRFSKNGRTITKSEVKSFSNDTSIMRNNFMFINKIDSIKNTSK